MVLLIGVAVAVGVAGWLKRKVHCIMADLAEVKAAVARIATGVDNLEEAIKDLKEQVASGSSVSQADLDDLAAQIKAIGDDIDDTSDQ